MDGSLLYLFLVTSLIVAVPVSTSRESHLNSRHSAGNKRIAKSLHRPINFRNFHQLGTVDNIKTLGLNRAIPTDKEQLIIRKRRQDPGSTTKTNHREQDFLDALSNHISTHIVDPVIQQLEHVHLESQLKDIINGRDSSGSYDLPPKISDALVANAAPDASMKEFGRKDSDSRKAEILPELAEISSVDEVEELNPTFVLPQEKEDKLHVVEDPIKESIAFFSGDGSGSGDTGFLDEGSGYVDTMFTFTKDEKYQTGDEEVQSIMGDSQVDWNPSPVINGLQEQLSSIREQVAIENVQSESMDGLHPNNNDMTKAESDENLDRKNEFENQLLNIMLEREEKDQAEEDEALQNFLLPFSREYIMTSLLMNDAGQIEDAEIKEPISDKLDAKVPQKTSSVETTSSDLSKEEHMEIVSDDLLIDHQGDKQKQLKVLTTCSSVSGNEIMILPEDLCDGTKDCIDGEDENPARCEGACSPGYSKCDDGLQCLKDNLFCNGIHQCHDRSDESDCERTMADCEVYGMFSCDGVCRLKSFLCDHTFDCSDDIDEQGCSYEIFSCPDGFNFDDAKLQCVYHV